MSTHQAPLPDFLQQALSRPLPSLPSYSFYNGEVTVYYDDGPHAYTRFYPNGDYGEVLGVTTGIHIIDKSDALTKWAANMTRDYALSKLEAGKAYSIEELNTILNEASNHFREIAEQAADIGKAAHNCLEDSILEALRHTGGVVKTLVNLPFVGMKIKDVLLTEAQVQAATNCATHAFEWMQKHNVRWIFTERKVYSRKYDYSGTMDGLALVDACGDRDCCGEVVDGRLVPCTFKDVMALIDWKSSNQLYDEYRFQTAAYEYAHEEEFGIDIQMRFVLRLGKTEGDFQPWRIPAADFDQDFAAFLEAITLYRTCQEVKYRERERKAEVKEAKSEEKAEAKAAEKEAKAAAKAAAKAERDAEKRRLAEEKAAKQAAEKPARVKKRRTKKTANDDPTAIPEIADIPEETALVQ